METSCSQLCGVKRVTTRFTTPFGAAHMGTRLPKYSLHAPTGQAYVRIGGKFHYLGEYDSEDSRKRYDEVVGKLSPIAAS